MADTDGCSDDRRLFDESVNATETAASLMVYRLAKLMECENPFMFLPQPMPMADGTFNAKRSDESTVTMTREQVERIGHLMLARDSALQTLDCVQLARYYVNGKRAKR